MNSEELYERLCDALKKDCNEYLDSLQSLSLDEVVGQSYETVYKKDILFLFEEYDNRIALTYDELKALVDMEHPLDALYSSWLDSNNLTNDMLCESINQCGLNAALRQCKTNSNELVDDITVEDKTGTWYVIDSKQYGDETLYLVESEIYGEDAPHLIIDKDHKLILDEVWNGFDDYDEMDASGTTPTVEMTYEDMKKKFKAAERKHDGTHINGYIVFSNESFEIPYPVESRTYVVNSKNKAFMPNMGGYSIYGSSLDGKDDCVRLERYMSDEYGGKDGWHIEKCYMNKSDLSLVPDNETKPKENER